MPVLPNSMRSSGSVSRESASRLHSCLDLVNSEERCVVAGIGAQLRQRCHELVPRYRGRGLGRRLRSLLLLELRTQFDERSACLVERGEEAYARSIRICELCGEGGNLLLKRFDARGVRGHGVLLSLRANLLK